MGMGPLNPVWGTGIAARLMEPWLTTGEKDWATKLLDFIVFERACCPFFTFELTFEPDSGPIWLRLRGQEGVKEFIKQDLHL